MAPFDIRPAHDLDAREMAEILTEIIAIGGTTALAGPVGRDDMIERMRAAPGRAAWHVAEGSEGAVLAFQWIAPHRQLPPEVCDIATFAKPGQQGLGIASRLFEATKAAARDLGYAWINAAIRADNAPGLAYYQSRGFEIYGRLPDQPSGEGGLVDKVLKRYDLL